MNNLSKLLEAGQSYWLDNLTRGKIKKGEIKKRVEKQGLRGITSNPSIFNKAISKGNEYDAQIKKLIKENKGVQEIYEALLLKMYRMHVIFLNRYMTNRMGRMVL